MPAAYYDLDFVRRAYADRLAAVEALVPKGSTVIDLGCSDGRISRALLASGRARSVTAVDVVDQIGDEPDGLRFVRADLSDPDVDLDGLGRADVILMLNLLHHVVADSVAAARGLMVWAVASADLVIVDLGSFTEIRSWPWRLAYERYWRNDYELWNDLFAPAAHRRPVLRYHAQGPGSSRVLFAITSGRT